MNKTSFIVSVVFGSLILIFAFASFGLVMGYIANINKLLKFNAISHVKTLCFSATAFNNTNLIDQIDQICNCFDELNTREECLCENIIHTCATEPDLSICFDYDPALYYCRHSKVVFPL